MVVAVADNSAGLRAFIAIHSTALGPALGGCRMWPYRSEDDALADVLRLSKGMSYKNALAGHPYGGGKAVIIGDPRSDKTPALFHAFGHALNRVGGNYITAEDSGTSIDDMEAIAEVTRHVAGRKAGHAASGDPSHFTALGVFLGIKETLRAKTGLASVDGQRVAIAGLGNVGTRLAKMLRDEGARLTVSDIDNEKTRQAAAAWGATPMAADRIHAADVDVYAPCALGGAINAKTVAEISAGIVAGGANNQLDDEALGVSLWQRNILYAPDFIINAGGVMNVGAEVSGSYDLAAVTKNVECIPETLKTVFAIAASTAKPTNIVAQEMARDKIVAGRPQSGRQPSLTPLA